MLLKGLEVDMGPLCLCSGSFFVNTGSNQTINI